MRWSSVDPRVGALRQSRALLTRGRKVSTAVGVARAWGRKVSAAAEVARAWGRKVSVAVGVARACQSGRGRYPLLRDSIPKILETRTTYGYNRFSSERIHCDELSHRQAGQFYGIVRLVVVFRQAAKVTISRFGTSTEISKNDEI